VMEEFNIQGKQTSFYKYCPGTFGYILVLLLLLLLLSKFLTSQQFSRFSEQYLWNFWIHPCIIIIQIPHFTAVQPVLGTVPLALTKPFLFTDLPKILGLYSMY